MKTVYLLRHAKSSWDDPTVPDFRRGLSPRGEKAAPRVGRYMAKEGMIPHRVLCSKATRALSTWVLLSEMLGTDIPVEVREDIYRSTPQSLLSLIRDLSDEENSVLLIGHNPTFEELALALAGTGKKAALESLDRKYPTGALAILDFSTDVWQEIREGAGYLRDFIRPKSLK